MTMHRRRRLWRRFLLIGLLVLLALRRVEATVARMEGGAVGPSRILRIAAAPGEWRIALFGWERRISRGEAPSR